MKEILQAFSLVEAASGRNAKMAILRDIVAKYPNQVRELVQYTTNPMWSYRTGAPSSFSVQNEITENVSENYWFVVREILDGLRSRKIQMSDAKSSLIDVFNQLDWLHQKWFTRVINRDFKFGFQDWNKFFPGLIPAEPVMLCNKWDGEKLEGNWVAEPKLDGLRAAVMVDEHGNCTAISRGNKEFWNWEHIANQITLLGLKNVVLDGEFYAGNFGLSLSITKSQRPHSEARKLNYWIFDMLTMDEWNSLECNRTLGDRKAAINQTIQYFENYRRGQCGTPVVDCPNLIIAEPVPVHSIEEIEQVAQSHYDLGFEGSVLKRLDSRYVWDRSSMWLKIKPEEDADLTIVGANVGQGRHSDRLGALVVEGTVTYKKKQYQVRSNVGGGLSDVERDRLWVEHRNGTLIGKCVEVTFQDVTSEVCLTEGTPSLRFPKFKRMRPDKDRS